MKSVSQFLRHIHYLRVPFLANLEGPASLDKTLLQIEKVLLLPHTIDPQARESARVPQLFHDCPDDFLADLVLVGHAELPVREIQGQ